MGAPVLNRTNRGGERQQQTAVLHKYSETKNWLGAPISLEEFSNLEMRLEKCPFLASPIDLPPPAEKKEDKNSVSVLLNRSDETDIVDGEGQMLTPQTHNFPEKRSKEKEEVYVKRRQFHWEVVFLD